MKFSAIFKLLRSIYIPFRKLQTNFDGKLSLQLFDNKLFNYYPFLHIKKNDYMLV